MNINVYNVVVSKPQKNLVLHRGPTTKALTPPPLSSLEVIHFLDFFFALKLKGFPLWSGPQKLKKQEQIFNYRL